MDFSTKITSTSLFSANEQKPKRIGIIGGGASGMFAAAAAANAFQKNSKIHDHCEVIVLEGTKRTMTKVSISGGGRCNVLHDTRKPTSDILSSYPRGRKELTGIFSKHFTPMDARRWFESQGVTLKTEEDGRVFPVSDNSQTIIDAIESAAQEAGVMVIKQARVVSIEKEEGTEANEQSFLVSYQNDNNLQEKQTIEFDCVILATGSSKKGYEFAESLGHTIVEPVPSLFTLTSKEHVRSENGVLHGLSGVSIPFASVTLKVKVPGKKKKKLITQEGPLLITHHGISGPAALRLSAFAAREFHECNYQTSDVIVNWIPKLALMESSNSNVIKKKSKNSNNLELIQDLFWEQTFQTPKRSISSACPFFIAKDESDGSFVVSTHDEFNSKEIVGEKIPLLPKRLWGAFVSHSGFDKAMTWAQAPKKKIHALARNLYQFDFHVSSKGVFKEEFVTAGGVKLKEIKMESMASKKCEGFFCCGEVIDVDGITGGFNFMNCWSTGYMAGNGAADFIMKKANEVDAG